MKPRAKRIALIVASVPELTIRTSSIEGTSWHTFFAREVSIAVGAPNPKPLSKTAFTASIITGLACPKIIGPQEPT